MARLLERFMKELTVDGTEDSRPLPAVNARKWPSTDLANSTA
jgi:hypothetical protein